MSTSTLNTRTGTDFINSYTKYLTLPVTGSFTSGSGYLTISSGPSRATNSPLTFGSSQRRYTKTQEPKDIVATHTLHGVTKTLPTNRYTTGSSKRPKEYRIRRN